MTLVARYPLQEDSGTTVSDVVDATDGSAVGGTPNAAGPLGGSAWNFDGTDDQIRIGSTPWHFAGQDSFSLSAVFKWDGSTGNTKGIFESVRQTYTNHPIGNPTYAIRLAGDGTPSFQIQNANNNYVGSDGDTVPPVDEWVHMVGVRDAEVGDLRVYVDDTESTASFTGDIYDYDEDAAIGTWKESQGRYFSGALADVRIYDHPLTASEVSYLGETYRRGTTTLGTKSFSSAQTPSLAADYTLNGSTAVVDVIGSPDTQNQEVQQVTLDGSASFDLTWNSSHTDFRIAVSLGDETSIAEAAPTITALTLS